MSAIMSSTTSTMKRAVLAATLLAGAAHAQNDRWENSEGDGNVRIAVEDETFNWGDAPPWHVLDEIKNHCSSVGCHSDDKLYVPTKIISGYNRMDRELELSIQGSFSENDNIGSLEDLVEIAKAASAVNYEVNSESYDSGRSCERPGSSVGCNPLNEGSEPTQYSDQYHQFNQIHVRVDEGTGPDLLVKITVKDADIGAGWCAGILGAGAALAGAVEQIPGPVGSAFSLGSLICGNI